MRYFLIPLIALLAFSCDMKKDKTASYYYDTDSLMKQQKKLLWERGAYIEKKARINGDVETANVSPDSLQAWNNEFQIFDKMNINKPVLNGVYEITEYDDKTSNLTVREYTTEKDKVEVTRLKIYYLKDINNLRFLEARYSEDNPIYKSQRDLKITFDDFTGVPLLHKYEVTGTQKMLMKDTVQFVIQAEVKFKTKE